MQRPDVARKRGLPVACFLLVLAVFAVGATGASAQSKADDAYARRNTVGILGEYSPDSSHILLGESQRRMLVNLGVSYSRRLFLNHIVNWQYNGELLPVALESDPLSRDVAHQTMPSVATFVYSNGSPPVACAPQTFPYEYQDPNTGATYSGTQTVSCAGRRWTMGEAMSPVGFQWNFVPMRKTQPFLDGHGGYMYSTRTIPIPNAGSFNFTFDIGAGIELYRNRTQSMRVEYRYHHLSNANTAQVNPGVDSGLIQVTYCFRLGHQ